MLTDSQVVTLRAAILAEADAAFVEMRTNGATGAMAAWLNQDAPGFYVWKTRVTEQEITSLTSSDATVWSWPAYIARTEAERNGWARMFNGTYSINPSLAQVRTGIADIFSGSANNAPAQRAHLLAMGKRLATRAEKLFATGTGTSAVPATMGMEGQVGEYDVIRALNP